MSRNKTNILSKDASHSGDAKKELGIESIERTVANRFRDDVVIGIVSLKGSGGTSAAKSIKEQFSRNLNAICHILTVSDFIRTQLLSDDGEDLQNAGNRLRNDYSPDILARWAVSEIHRQRDSRGRQVFIIDSIKHPAEVTALRALYGTNFWLLATFCPLDRRLERIQRLNEFSSKSLAQIREMLERDEDEGLPWGQRVSDASALADYFIRNDSNNIQVLHQAVDRFSKIVFPGPPLSPTRHETGMFYAATAARASMCLSRHVGAALISKAGEILATGYNEAPIAGGGHYQSSTPVAEDNRCFGGEHCHNDRQKDLLATDIANELIKKGLVETGAWDELYAAVRRGRISKLLEFSRSIHAEMSAILSAARQGSTEIVGSSLYVTTFPCHNCARHIIAAGISEVQFIEPFSKSLAIDLHSDSISTHNSSDPAAKDSNKVRFLQYEGIGTFRYFSTFLEIQPEKLGSGVIVKRDRDYPVSTGSKSSIEELEAKISASFPLENRLL